MLFARSASGALLVLCRRWRFDSGRTSFVVHSKNGFSNAQRNLSSLSRNGFSNAQRNLSSLSRNAICDTSMVPPRFIIPCVPAAGTVGTHFGLPPLPNSHLFLPLLPWYAADDEPNRDWSGADAELGDHGERTQRLRFAQYTNKAPLALRANNMEPTC
eukprot:3568665-Prymnesium_polylepis.1